MRRRQALQSIGTILGVSIAAGCLGTETDEFRTEGNDDEPLAVDPEELLLPAEALRERFDLGWTEEESVRQKEAMFHDADAARRFIPYDGEQGFHMESGTVTTGAWLYDDVETARESYRTHPYQDGWGFEEREIASESMAGDGNPPNEFRLIFRDANAIGGLQYENDRVNDDERVRLGLELAVQKHERWR